MKQTGKSLTCMDNVKVRNISEQNIGSIGGQLKQFSFQWQCVTSDMFILGGVKHCKIEFENGEPQQLTAPREINFTKHEQEVIDKEIDQLLLKGVISETMYCFSEYISTILIHPKRDGGYRLILNLNNLNEHVVYHHFEMNTLQSAIQLMTPNCHMASHGIRRSV